MSPKPDTHATTATATPLPADTHATAAAAVALPAAADHGLRIGSASDPYTAILELAEYELQLARDGRIEDLRLLAPQWDALTADLPEQPPISARGALERATALHERTSATLQCLREGLMCDLRTTARASRAAHGYAGQAPRRVHRMDHSA
jgi:hypothetical protein